MDLFKIQNDLIADRSAEGWYRINIAGPFFHYRWSFGTGGDGPFSYVTSEHSRHAVCREEPCLTMSWGMEVYDREDRNELHFPWAEVFVNSTVRPFWVDFFWNNALVDRVELCSIDGGHGTIPIPSHDMQVSEFDTSVAFLVHDLDGGPDHDNPGRYLDMLEASRVRDQDRWGAGSAS